MTPLDAAVLVGSKRFDGEVEGLRAYAEFNADDARAIIRAFLEAAMRDDDLCLKVASGFAMEAAVASMSFDRNADIRVARSAILALKETING